MVLNDTSGDLRGSRVSWSVPARDHEQMPSQTGGQDWLVSWHQPDDPPSGRPHGAAGICVAEGDRLVLISADGVHWGFPAGRPEDGERIEETLRRELWEEACVRVLGAQLLGFARGECVAGREVGVGLFRSYWRAEVEVLAWEPRFEIAHRRIVPAVQARESVRDPDEVATRISLRALIEAGLG
jgi:8-oxo-dGTP pyrophosphatase MutT (NUDIX family)